MARRAWILAVVGVLMVAGGFGLGRWTADPGSASSSRMSAADVGFAQDMSTHHEQAVLLAQTLPRDAGVAVRSLADQIILAQHTEIAMMHGWLTLAGEPLNGREPMVWMHNAEHRHAGTRMPGMASVEEISLLSGLRGREAEVLFLQLMIRHHRGGMEMAEAAYNRPVQQVIRATAMQMIRGQGDEIGLMTTMLHTHNSMPLPYP